MSVSPTVRRTAAALLLTLGFLAQPAWAALRLDGAPKVTFFAKGSPGALDIEGKTSVLIVVDDGTTLTFKVPLATVETGIALRDQHMRDKYLEVQKFPEAVLTVTKADLTFPTPGGEATEGVAKGTFTVHGVTKEVDITWTMKPGKKGFGVTAEFPYNVQDYGIEIPSYLGVTVDPAQRLETRFNLVDI